MGSGVTILLLLALLAGEAKGPKPDAKPEAQADPKADAPVEKNTRAARVELNLQGQTDTSSGESRRNENIQFNPIDNNALKELNIRMGTTATIVQEFDMARNYFGAEFGRPVPTSLHVAEAKASGLHGNLYETHNNSIFSARSFFQVGSVKPAHTNDYGFQLGSPVWRDAFLSISGGEQRIRGSVNGNVLVPTAVERTPLAADPQLRQFVLRVLAAYPAELPNRTDISPHALNTNSPQSIDTDNAGIRLDQLHAGDRFSAQYRFPNQKVTAFEFIAGQNPDSDTKAHTLRMTWNRGWNSRTITTFSAGFDRLRSLIVPEPNSVGPQISFGGSIDQLGPSSNLPIDRTQNQFRYAGEVQRQASSHTWRAGFEILRRQINGSEYSSQRGVITFASDFGHDAMTNFRLGMASRYSVGIGDPHRGFRNWDTGFYAGDDWHALPNFTVDFGLRYQPVTTPTEVNHLTVIPYGCQCKDFAPRLGFAYRLPGRWGVLRAAYGLHYGQIYTVTFQQLRFNPPGVIKLEIHNPDLRDPLAGADIRPGARSTVFAIPSNLSTPYSHQYNFTWEPVIATRWKLQLGYVGSRSEGLLLMLYNNRAQPVAGISQTNETVDDRRPDVTHFDVRTVTNSSRGYFDAGRVSVVMPRWHGFTIESSYWFSKAIDLGGNYTNPATSTDNGQVRSQSEFLVRNDLKGLSNFDQTHSFLTRVVYATGRAGRPRWLANWNLSAIVLLKTGSPFDVISGSDAPGYGNVDGSAGDRVNVLDPSVLGRTIGNPDTSRALLPRSAFYFMQPTDLRGNIGHNVVRKGGIANINAGLERSWQLGSDKSLQVRAESINFFNTPQFAQPGAELTSPNFGLITNTLNDGRTFRFLLRLAF
jgi:hypothetical protein